jgi:hypothetical protein
VNYKRLRHDDAILIIHRYIVIGLSGGELVGDVAYLHGRRNRCTMAGESMVARINSALLMRSTR